LLGHGDAAHQIVAGLCFSWVKTPGGLELGPNWFDITEDGITSTQEINQSKLNPVTYCGMAFTLLGRKVLSAVRKDNAQAFGMTTFGHDLMWATEDQVTLGGEDTTFCVRAARLGYKSYGAGDVVVDHYKMHAENLQSFKMRYPSGQ
jgi:hypothetical protein